MNKDSNISIKAELVHCKQADMNELLNRFAKFLDVSSSSVHTYKFCIRRFLQFLNENGITNPNRENVLTYKKELISKNFKSSTVALYLSSIRRFFTWLESENLYSNITAGIKSPKQDKGHRRDAFSALQLQSIIGAMKHETLQGKRDYAIFCLIASCGLRTVEVMRADVGDMREMSGSTVLYVCGKGRSSKSEFVKLAQPVVDAIREYLRMRAMSGEVSENEPLFASCSRRNNGQRLTTKTVSTVCKSAMRMAGFDNSRLTAHSLRHSAVTIALLAGCSLQEVCSFARHASVSTTMIYSHDCERLKSQVESSIADALFAA